MNRGIYFRDLVCILVITALFGVAIPYVEIPFLESFPPQLSNLTMGEWVESFQKWAIGCVVSAGLASLLWYGLAQSVFKAGKRIVWGLLLIVVVIITILSCFYVEKAESSLWLAKLFFVSNGVVPYYLTTLLFSPLSFKYTPPLAELVRSRCPW